MPHVDSQEADVRVRKVLRMQAWERAKGELNAALATFWQEPDEFREAHKEVNAFIKKVEDESHFS